MLLNKRMPIKSRAGKRESFASRSPLDVKRLRVRFNFTLTSAGRISPICARTRAVRALRSASGRNEKKVVSASSTVELTISAPRSLASDPASEVISISVRDGTSNRSLSFDNLNGLERSRSVRCGRLIDLLLLVCSERCTPISASGV